MWSNPVFTALRNVLFKAVAFWVLVFAAYLALGRQFIPYVSNYQAEIEIWLSDRLNTEVRVQEVHGEWVRFNPVIRLSNVSIGDHLVVDHILLAPGIYDSIVRGGLSFIRFELSGFNSEIVETANGWQLKGLNDASTGGGWNLQALIDLLQRQQQVQFSQSRIRIQPSQLPEFTLTLENGELQGFGNINSMIANATIALENYAIPIQLQIDSTRSDVDRTLVYFRHGSLDLSPWLANEIGNLQELVTEGEYWISFSGTEWQDATARMDVDSLTLSGRDQAMQVNELKLETFVQREANGMQAWLNLREYKLADEQFDSTQIKLSLRAERLKAEWDSLPAAWVGNVLAMNDAGNFWNTTSPSGFIEQGSAILNNLDMDTLRLQASVNDLAMKPFQAVPGFANVSADLRLQGLTGAVDFSTQETSLQLPLVFENSTLVTDVNGTLSWQFDPGQGTQLQGNARALFSEIDGVVVPLESSWSVGLPNALAREQGRENSLEFNLNTQKLSAAEIAYFSDNNFVPRDISDWVATNLLAGEADDVSLKFLSSTDLEKTKYDQFSLTASLNNAAVNYYPDWPIAENISGLLAIDLNGLQLSADNLTLAGLESDDAKLSVPFKENIVLVDASSPSNVQSILTFLKNAPFREAYGEVLQPWFATGEAESDIYVAVPLSGRQPIYVETETQISNGRFAMADLDFLFTGITGLLSFSSENGLFADKINFNHEGLPQELSLAATNSTANLVELDVSGETLLSFWGERINNPFLSQQTDIVKHDSGIQVTRSGDVMVSSRSELRNLALPFPSPLDKPVGDALPSELDLVFDVDGTTTVQVTLNEKLISLLELDSNNEISRGTLVYDRPVQLPETSGMVMDFYVEKADGDAWLLALQEFDAMYGLEETEQADSLTANLNEIRLEFAELNYLSFPWRDVKVSIIPSDGQWTIDFESIEADGRALVSQTNEPILIELDFLQLNTEEDSDTPFAEETDPLIDYLPIDVPAMDVAISEFIWNDIELGQWQAEFRTRDNQLAVNDITGVMDGVNLSGEFGWQVQDERHESWFTGRAEVENVQDVLNTWQYAPVLTSRDGFFDIDISWRGSPAFFDFRRIEGVAGLELNRGAILNAEDYEGVKFIGLLNFTRVLQRIALDFSDVVDDGITFDVVEGEILFDRGFARVGEQLIIDGSSTKFQFTGDADLINDSLDVDMVLTIPLSSTFPLVALLAGVTPQAAAAIYVTERIFNDELERLSSARIHIVGSLDEPQVLFYRAGTNEEIDPDTGLVVP